MIERLDKFLAAQGKGTRKEVGRLIRSGAVAVDGVPVRDPAAKVDPSRQTVAVGGNPILWQEHLYIMMNKPAGVLSATEELCAAADPATYAGAAMCPVYVQHGTHDRLVPYEQSVEFVQALRDAGLGERVSFDPIPGADHEDKLFFTDENLDRVRAFLERTMKEE